MKLLKSMFAACAMFVISTNWAMAELRVGVLAPAGEIVAMQQWSALSDEIADTIGSPISLRAAGAKVLLDQMENGALDVIIGNPVQATIGMERLGVIPVASVVKSTGDRFGGVIIANPNAAIASAQDLKGKSVATLRTAAAGGYIFQAHYLTELGINVPGDFAKRTELKSQKDIVTLVARGVFDAGFVRTGMVERMINQGVIAAGDVVIVDGKQTEGFPQVHSTELYPEWMVFAASDLDPAVVKSLGSALSSLTDNSNGMKTAGVSGFTAPLDLGIVRRALQAVGAL